jgi:hypothetical protein
MSNQKETKETPKGSIETSQKAIPSKNISEEKLSYTHSIMQKRKAVLDQAVQAYELAVKKRTHELGKLCLESGLGDYDTAFLKEQILKLAGSLPKRNSPE